MEEIIINEDIKVDTNFNLYNKILDYSKYVRTNILITIPIIHRDVKIHLADEIYNLSKLLFLAVYNKGNVRMKYLIEIQATLSCIDMLSTTIIDLKCCSIKKVKVSLKKLEEIKNIIYAWIINEKKVK